MTPPQTPDDALARLTPADFRSRTEISVRFRDLDAMGHVNNAVYFTFLEQGRVQYMRDLNLPAGIAETKGAGGGSALSVYQQRFPFVLVEAGCRYLAPVEIDTVLVVHTQMKSVGRKSFHFQYLITRKMDGQRVAVAWSAQVCYDYRSGRPRAVFPDLVERAERLEKRSLRKSEEKKTIDCH